MKAKIMFLGFSSLLLITSFSSASATPVDNALANPLLDPKTWRELFSPLPAVAASEAHPLTAAKIALGRRLFFEKRLSKSGELSCNSCHDLNSFGVDNEATSAGHEGKRGSRNSPSVYNAALHAAQFWDGRAKDVEEQALGPVMNPIEMAMPTETQVVALLREDPSYVSAFAAAFPEETDPISFRNVGKAIGAFERTLITPSRFDAFLSGDSNALSPQELEGLRTFRDIGCASCHGGSTLGGLMFQKLGLVRPYATNDLGRYETTKLETDKYVFKVPSLRNIEKTGPYFHDGSITTLEQAVRIMGEHQLGRSLSDEQVTNITAFLKSLTGALPKI